MTTPLSSPEIPPTRTDPQTLGPRRHPVAMAAAAVALIALGAGGGLWWGQRGAAPHAAPAGDLPMTTVASAASATSGERKVLYWYDPMSPATKFDKPGKSPFMDMQLVPKYADEAGDAGAVRIDPTVSQNLGMRVVEVTRSAVQASVHATGVVAYNDRDVAIVQARSAGFVERVAPLAPGDVIAAGALIAEMRVPEWMAAQQEFLALKATRQVDLITAARERMRLTGMPEPLMRAVETSGRLQPRVALRAPRAGVLQELGVRTGMNLMAGQTVARINGITTVWLDLAVPEVHAGQVRVGQVAHARLVALAGESIEGRVTALLPALDEASRALRVRVELPNPEGRLRPGFSAQASLQSLPSPAAKNTELSVPTEAVIRTGTRTLVLVAEDGGRYRPVEVKTGGEGGGESAGRTRILSGLTEGQKVVASGQFLIDSEASLSGLTAQDSTDTQNGGTR